MRTGRWCATQCGNCSTNLCTAIAKVIKKLCAAYNLLTSIEASLAWHLVPLDKNHGLHPIGIEEILHQIAGKVIVTHITQQIFVSHFEKKKTQNENIFTQFEFILARPNNKTSGLAGNLIETFYSHLKVNKSRYIALFLVSGSMKKFLSIDCVYIYFSQSIVNYLFSIFFQ